MSVRNAALIVAALVAPLAAGAQGGPAVADMSGYSRAPQHSGVEKSSRYIPSFDGTRLAVTVYRPASLARSGERLPVIVTQARSDVRPESLKTIQYFVERGYVWVAQDRRGTGASFGVQTGFVDSNDARDAKAVIEWAGSQPFSNGKVGAYGCSNQGAWQYVVLKHRPKYLKAIAPACSSAQFFDHGISLNGIPMLALGQKHYAGECDRPAGGARPAQPDRPGAPAVDRRTPGPQPVDEDKDGALARAAAAGQRCGSGLMGQYWLNMPRDGYNSFAKNRPAIDDSALSYAAAARAAGVQVLQIGGWYDAAVAGQFESQRIWGGKAIMGPWIHGNRALRGATFPGDTMNIDGEILRWFDSILKGIANGAGDTEIVYYTVNAAPGTEWRRARNWSVASAAKQRLFLTNGSLTARPPVRAGEPVTYAQRDVKLFDGEYAPLRRFWTGDMRAADARSLVHSMAPLASDMEVTGTPSARLWVSADTRDANVFAILEDVAPDGRSTYVTAGRLRASWRQLHTPPWGRSSQLWHRGFARDLAPLTPGQPVELAFDFFPISYVFKRGHRLQVSIVTSIGEAYQAPPLAAGKPVSLTLYRDAARPSAIELPIVR